LNPIRMLRRSRAKLDTIGIVTLADLDRFGGKSGLGLFIVGENAALHAKGVRDQRVAEQHAFDMGQGQNAGNRITPARDEIMRPMAKSLFDNAPPAGQMKKSTVRMCVDEIIPRPLPSRIEPRDGQRWHQIRRELRASALHFPETLHPYGPMRSRREDGK